MSALEYDFAASHHNAPPTVSQPAVANDRRMERAFANLRAIVQVKENPDTAWKEVAKVSTVSRNGLGVTLTRPCVVGRLVNVILPMPPEYRAFDLGQELYQVVGIVQYCNPSTIDGERVYHAGLGLAGKDVPQSFLENPKQNYRIAGMSPNGLWSITEAASQFKHRKNPRYWITLPVSVTLIHRDDESVKHEETFTKNVSLTGLSVATTLKAHVGNKVRLACKPLNFHAIALVRAVKVQPDGGTTLHLELDGQRFPVDLVSPASSKS